MNAWRIARLSGFGVLLLLAVLWFRHTHQKAEDVTLVVTFVICLVTAVYSLFTFEILVENQAMSRAASQSAALMEKSLRFPSSAHLSYTTVATKNPDISAVLSQVIPYRNEDFDLATQVAQSGSSDCDFVFAIVENKGPGTATKVSIEAEYKIVDSGSANRDVNVRKVAKVPIMEPNTGIALCIFISRLPTQGDGASLISASVASSDFYRDAIGDAAQLTPVSKDDHQTDRLAGSVLRIS